MPNVVHLSGQAHRTIQLLLPWYVTGQVDAADAARIEAHLSGCAECAAQLELDRKLNAEVTRTTHNVDQGWASMREQIAEVRPKPVPRREAQPVAIPQPSGSQRLLGSDWKRWLGLGFGAQLALTTMVLAAFLPVRFQALSSDSAAASGNVIVIFRPETSEMLLRQTLQANTARLVDGPTSANAYVLSVPAGQRAVLVKNLRATPHVILAEPIGEGATP